MRTTFECDQFAVFDDVLPADSVAGLWTYFRAQPFKPVDKTARESPWRAGDGSPLTGPAVAAWVDPAQAVPDSKLALYPTGTPVDDLVEHLLGLTPRLERWVGKVRDEWALLTAIAWRYPVGSALSWHSDTAVYSGAFTFYAHPAWQADWGGELVLAHPSARSERELMLDDERQPRLPDREALDRRIAEHGIGHHVMPRPNRLVVVAGGHPHRVARVEAAAGDAVRASFSGFFVRARSLATLVAARA